jgi:hypothetical protein
MVAIKRFKNKNLSVIIFMKILIDINTIDNYKYNSLIPFECEYCKSKFTVLQKMVKHDIFKRKRTSFNYCSNECKHKAATKGKIYYCTQCNKEIYKTPADLSHKNRKSNNVFCDSKCSGIYNSQHKTTGTRRSKLEKWLETKLIDLYPNLIFDFNKTSTINAELDIYIPSLKLAFELNGPFHYEPIFGQEKLSQIQNNDQRKFQACLEQNIELCIIDTSKQKYFKEKTCLPFLEIIINIINQKMVQSVGFAPTSQCF